MTINTGIWIDHRKAVVVRITDDGEDILQVSADGDTPVRRPGDIRFKHSHTPNDFVAEDKRERKEMIRLNKYYDVVITLLRDAESILVVGPGEAKGELVKRIMGKKREMRIAHVGTADKMTDREVAAYVRERFDVGFQQTSPPHVLRI